MAKDNPELGSRRAVDSKPDWARSPRERRASEGERQDLSAPRRRWPWFLILMLVLVTSAAWFSRDRFATFVTGPSAGEIAPVTQEKIRPTQLNQGEWTVLEPMNLRRTVKVIGPLRASRRADLAAETGGQVEMVDVRPGDRVQQGQALVQIDVEGLAIDLDLARSNAEATQAQLALAEEQLDRQEELVGRGVAATTTVNELRTNVEALRANLSAQEDQIAAAGLALDRATVRAPFDGIVASRSAEPGTVVASGAPLLSVVDLEQMEMLASASVSAGVLIASGQEVEIDVDGLKGRRFTGVVERVAPVAEEGTRTLTVFVAVPNDDEVLLGGMFATGSIVLEEAQDVLALPREAIRHREGNHVLVVRDETLQRQDVQMGREWPGGLVQIEGLEAGAKVVTAPLAGLEVGEPVEFVDY